MNYVQGDYLVHTIFPPAEGPVVNVVNDSNDPMVTIANVVTGVLFYDRESNWQLKYKSNENLNEINGSTESDEDVIDVDFKEL